MADFIILVPVILMGMMCLVMLHSIFIYNRNN